MKNLAKLLLICLCFTLTLSLFAACGKEDGQDDFDLPTDPFGIVMSVRDVTPTGMTLVLTQSGGSATGELQTAASFRLDQAVYSNWVHLDTILGEDEEYVWDETRYTIPKDGVCEIVLDWTDLYGTLPAGSYRLAKGIADIRSESDADAFTYFVEFEITE